MLKELRKYRHRLEVLTAVVVVVLAASSIYVYYHHYYKPNQRLIELRQMVLQPTDQLISQTADEIRQ